MNLLLLTWRGLVHYRRTNGAVVAGVACAVAVLTGALIVGESVRGSLRAIATARLGNAALVVTAETFFGERLCSPAAMSACVPIINVDGAVVHEASGRRASNVAVYGIDDRFFAFHRSGALTMSADAPWAGLQQPMAVLLSPALARDLDAGSGDSLVVRVARPTDIPLESLHGRRDDGGRAIRAISAGALPAGAMGEFALTISQGEQRSVFLPLARLQRDLGVPNRVNAILVSRPPDEPGTAAIDTEEAVRRFATLEDLGVRWRRVTGSDAGTTVSVESDAGLLSDALIEAVRRAAAATNVQLLPVLTYLANEMTVNGRRVPYSLLTAVDPDGLDESHRALRDALRADVDAPLVLNTWAARDMNAAAGDRVEIEYYRWLDEGRLVTEHASFTVSAVVPIAGLAADRDLAPEYPGITDTDSLTDWDPPFPIDLSRVRQVDEDYWHQYRTTPKAFIALGRGQQLWPSRWGSLTAVRVSGAVEELAAFERELQASLDPLTLGLQVIDVRSRSADAAEGSADFGMYFLGFSYFLVISALLLAALFFRFGVEQRLREIGVLTAVGFRRGTIRRLFLLEGLALAVLGSALGVAGGLAYAAFVMHGLRTWWHGAVNTTALSMHVTSEPLVAGAAAGVVTAALAIVLSMRGLRRLSPRSLLAGHSIDALASPRRSLTRTRVSAAVAGIGACVLVALGIMTIIPDAGAFFGAGLLLLIALLSVFSLMLRRPAGVPIAGSGATGFARLGVRNASWRPGRSVLSAALVAAAVFLIVSVDAFRRGGDETLEPRGGAGGFALVGESVVPIAHDLNTLDGREDAGLILDADVARDLQFYQLRLRPGDDTSCINLYKPKRPRVAGVPQSFIEANRFTFAASLAETEAQRENPWTLLTQPASPDQATTFPAIVDATSLQYVLHAAVGDVIVIDEDSTRPLRIQVVGTLQDSALQGEILVSDASFKQMFPDEQGFRMMVVDVAGARDLERLRDLAGQVERALDQVGFDAQLMSERLAAYHRVENTYLTTFQSLGALGLLLGTFGLATVLARNVFERRREIALLRAVGYVPRAVGLVVVAEHAALLVAGMAAGAIAAAVAILPAILDRGFAGGWTLPAWLAGIFVAGILITELAARAALRQPLLQELRSE